MIVPILTQCPLEYSIDFASEGSSMLVYWGFMSLACPGLNSHPLPLVREMLTIYMHMYDHGCMS